MAWPIIGLSMMAMCISSSSLVEWPADAHGTGIAVFNYGIAGPIVAILFFLTFSQRNKIFNLQESFDLYDKRKCFCLSTIAIIGYTFADAAVIRYMSALTAQLVFPGADLQNVLWGVAVLAMPRRMENLRAIANRRCQETRLPKATA